MKAGVDSVQNFEDHCTAELLLKVYSYLGAYLNIYSSVFYFVIYRMSLIFKNGKYLDNASFNKDASAFMDE